MSTEDKSFPVSQVIADELNAIYLRREKVFGIKREKEVENHGDDEDRRLTLVRLEALDKHVVGLSFSGGGIRSGTFAVGFLQGLAQVGLLRRIDYLSTVSGGGYAGAWLAAWLKRDGDPLNVERQLNPNRVIQAKAERALLPPLPGSGDNLSRVVDEEPAPIHHLRQYSSYLTPRPGLLTADTWTVIAIWLRNLSVNLLMMLLPLTMILVLTARIIIYGYAYLSPGAIDGDDTASWVCVGLSFVSGLLFLLFALCYNAKALADWEPQTRNTENEQRQERRRVPVHLFWCFLLPSICAVLLLTIPLRAVIWKVGDLSEKKTGGLRLFDYVNANRGLLDPPNLIFHGGSLGVIMAVCAWIVFSRNGIRWKYTYMAFFAGISAGVLIPLLEALTRYLNDAGKPELAATVIPPLALLIIVVGLSVEVALLGRSIYEPEREWWSRLCALLLIASLLWTVALVSIVYVPAALLASGPVLGTALASGWLATTALTAFGNLKGGRARPKAGSGDLLGTIAAVVPPIFLVGFLGAVSLFAASFVNMPPLASPNAHQDWTGVDRYFLGVQGASFWTMTGWLIFFSLVFWFGICHLDVNMFSPHAMYTNRLVRCYLGASRAMSSWAERWGDIHDPAAGGGASSLSVNRSAIRSWEMDHEKKLKDHEKKLKDHEKKLKDQEKKLKDLHEAALAIVPSTLYDAKRLAKNVQERREVSIEIVKQAVVDHSVRRANPATGFDGFDDIPLFDLGIERIERQDSPRIYWGPLLLINTTINLVAGEELAWRDRKGESFVLTPFYCGSKGVGYARMTKSTRENLTLGRAITISGAAVDPNMSFYQSSALTAFLTIFNARLGQWIQNPRFPDWKAEGPKFGDRLVAELFGRTDDKDAYVHLSDGGHFENLGVYELVRRRCRYIIAVNAGEDPDASDDNLARLTRLCRIDFGVRIELDTYPLEPVKPSVFSRTHVVVGRVHYEDVDSGQMPGIIVYIKISMTGDEPSDVLKYAKRDPRFPHQPTDLRQSFTDEQFESYRALGDHIARDVFSDAVRRVRDEWPPWNEPNKDVDEPDKNKDVEQYIRGNQMLFSSLRSRWATAPADHDARYIQSAEEWTRFHRDIRKEPALAVLSKDLYPELPPPTDKDLANVSESSRQRAELHAVAQMIQLMESAWINLRLKGHSDLPMDHGWMNVFRRWTGTKAFHRLWPTMRSEFSPEFVEFCERQLHLGIGKAPCHDYLIEGDGRELEVKSLSEEFRREWPALATSPTRDLAAMVKRAWSFQLDMGDPPTPHKPVWLLYQEPARPRFPCGVILLARSNDVEVDSRNAAAPAPPPPPPDHVFELFAWVRRPHRSTGLGSRAFLPIFDEIKAGLRREYSEKSLAVRTRYPKSVDEGDQELTMWENFFALYDFKPLDKTRTSPDVDGTRWTILEYQLNS